MDELVESVYVKFDDINKFEDVINNMSLEFDINGGYFLNIRDLDKMKDYVIKYEGDYDVNFRELNF